MARKVLISFLGTSNYLSTHYRFTDGTSAPVRFIQEAIVDHLCGDWTSEDRIYIFYTKGSHDSNWVDNGQPRVTTEEEKRGLEGILMSKPFAGIVEGVEVPEGFSEEEIWGIFEIVYSKLQEGDVIHFDVTHAFRSIPLFSTVLFNYSQFMKGTRLESIYYGAFEKLGPAYSVREMPIEERIAPVIDLTNIVKLQQYTEIAHEMVSYGRVGKVASTLKESDGQIFVKQVSDAIQNLDEALIASRLLDIKAGKYKLELDKNKKKLNKLPLPSPIKEVINRLYQSLDDFNSKNDFNNVAAAIEWAHRYDMLAQAYTLGREYILYLCTEKFIGYSPYNKNGRGMRDYREFFSSLLSIKQEDIENGNLKDRLQSYPELCNEMWQLEPIKQLRVAFKKFAGNRNCIDHAKGEKTFQDLKDEFRPLYDDCINILNTI